MNGYDEELPHVEGSEDDGHAASGAGRALRGEVVDAVPVGPYMAVVTLHRRRGAWVACATIETSVGPLRWCGVARESEVAERLARQHLQRNGASAGIDFGSFFQNLGRTVQQGTQQLARNRALRSTVSDIRRTLDRPELQPVLAVAQQIPYLGQAVTALRAATTIVDDVLGGNPETRDRLVRIRQAAAQGNPVAREAVAVIEAVLQSQQRVTRQRAQGGGGPQRPGPHRSGPSRGGRRGAPPRRGGPRGAGGPRRSHGGRSPSPGGARRGPTRGGARGGARRGGTRAPSPREQQAWMRAAQQWGQRVAGVAPPLGALPPIVLPPPPRF